MDGVALNDALLVIVGGGPVGSALALATAPAGSVLLESRAAGAPSSDPRPIALSHGSRLILERLDVWSALGHLSRIEAVHVSQRGGFGRVVMTAAEAGLPALGYVVEYAKLHAVLHELLHQRGARVVHGASLSAIRSANGGATVEYEGGGGSGAISAKVVAIADGAAEKGSSTAIDYGQCAVVALVTTEQPHRNIAFERFTPGGPLALLPFGEQAALIWSMEADEGRALCSAPEEIFLERLQDAFGARLGRFTAIGPRVAFPLGLKIARRGRPRTVHIGNAAQTLHPVAGQGLNLGLRDAWELAELIRDADPTKLGEAGMLEAWERRRRLDRGGSIAITDALIRIFSNDYEPMRWTRGAGLALLDALPPAKNFLARRMIFGARG